MVSTFSISDFWSIIGCVLIMFSVVIFYSTSNRSLHNYYNKYKVVKSFHSKYSKKYYVNVCILRLFWIIPIYKTYEWIQSSNFGDRKQTAYFANVESALRQMDRQYAIDINKKRNK